MVSINTNLSSLITQGSLRNSTSSLNQAIERMTTGFKINGAKDNAANYSISTNMTTRIGAYEVAESNVMMGLDLLSTATSSLDLISSHLTRLRALAEQAAKEGGKVDPKAYANSLPVFRRGRNFYIEVINPVTYASYVEFGHRTRGGGGWVAGQYFLTLSEKDLERVAPAVIEKKLEALLREAFNV